MAYLNRTHCRGGTPVLITRVDPLQEKPINGRVISRTATQLRISFQQLFDLEGQRWRYATFLLLYINALITISKIGPWTVENCL
jgi:hypothetical protein